MKRVLILAALAVGALVCYQLARAIIHTPLVRCDKLLNEITRERTEFVCAPALQYGLLLGVPQDSTNSYPLEGGLRLRRDDGRTIEVNFDSGALLAGRWLATKGVQGYMIPFPGATNEWEYNRYLRPFRKYEVMLRKLPPGSSVWLYRMYPSGWEIPLGVGDYLMRSTLREVSKKESE